MDLELLSGYPINLKNDFLIFSLNYSNRQSCFLFQLIVAPAVFPGFFLPKP